MGFYNIYTEGQQAEEYLMRKKAEEQNKKDADKEHSIKRVHNKVVHNLDNMAFKNMENNANEVENRDSKRRYIEYDVASSKVDMAANKYGIFSDEAKKAHEDRDIKKKNLNNYENDIFDNHDHTDAIERHMRRHPDQWEGSKRIKTRSEACGIFESVEFLNN